MNGVPGPEKSSRKFSIPTSSITERLIEGGVALQQTIYIV